MTATQTSLSQKIKQLGMQLGFADIGITHCDLSDYETDFFNWIEMGHHGSMVYMEAHGTKRTRPVELVPGTVSLISVRMNYFDDTADNALRTLHTPELGYISRYALGKDYHKLLRKRLQQLATEIQKEVPELQYRAFTDSAPVMEQAIAEQAGLGFIGKNSLIIHPRAGSWFFLGELYVNIELTPDPPFTKQGCGPCTACIQECPTQAILENNQIDARRCISYLTIEYDGVIDESLRKAMGNRIYGCDDCQLVCPWNRFAQPTQEPGFKSQFHLDSPSLLVLWTWDESKFMRHFEGSPIRRIGFEKWQRNLAVAIGNIENLVEAKTALALLQPQTIDSELVKIHVEWAIQQLTGRLKMSGNLQNQNKIHTNPIQPFRVPPFKVKKYYYPASKLKPLKQIKN